jgi:hypothetical protein
MIRCAAVFVFALALAEAAARAADSGQGMLPPQPATRPAGIPVDAALLSPCIATMGEHWGALKNMPTGPIYGVWQGKPVFTEIMVSVKQLDNGFSYANIHALPGYTIDHIDVNYEPNGHRGFPAPHYDVHAYYVSPAVQASICPNGMPDPAMKPMNQPSGGGV